MKSWRLAWVTSEIAHPSNFLKHHRVLRHSWKYWLALVLKFIPHAWPWPITLTLREGGEFVVRRFMTLFIYAEIFIDRCYDLPFTLPDNAVIVDVGSNTGLFILRMKQMCPDSIVVGFEPMPANFQQLQINLERSHARNVTVFECGVGGNARKETLHLHPRNIGGNSLYASQAIGGSEIAIDVIDIEAMLAKTPHGQCDLLKLDCEGAEFEIIEAMTPETTSRIRAVLIEPTPSLYDVASLMQHLSDIGYRISKNRGLYMAIRA